jgi:hypothetical protein
LEIYSGHQLRFALLECAGVNENRTTLAPGSHDYGHLHVGSNHFHYFCMAKKLLVFEYAMSLYLSDHRGRISGRLIDLLGSS